ncbi:MAG TPA: thiamine phosphate synthase [Candidatus Competibacteraceae bacterium]|nr:thiamine phosphate synthase [Candidatus Competibacteraceae bacterium]
MPLPNGLYVLTDATLIPAERFVATVEQAIRGGARVVQYRDKSTDPLRRRAQAGALVALCRELGVPLIVNDDVELAREVGADGVHLGRDDERIRAARARLGAGHIIGASCYDELARARRAQAAGADYLAFGSFFPSPTKPAAVRAGATLLRQARCEFTLPLVAIGGITPDNGAELIAAGADNLAVISGVFGQPDVAAAAHRYAVLFGG